MKKKLLVVDDEEGVRESLKIIFSGRYQVFTATGGEEALALLGQEKVDVVLLDIVMPGIDGLEVLRRISALSSAPQIIMLTATKTVQTAVAAMKAGACDYLTKPFDIRDLHLVVERAIAGGGGGFSPEEKEKDEPPSMIAASPAMQKVLAMVATVAPQKTTVLITGESGTGKELVARALHFHSPRRSQPFIAVNCAAIPEALLESELFGHERGAFTDAHSRRIGCFESAQGGTLFLDEIGEMSRATQAKILRAIEQKELTRVGGTQRFQVDVRLVAATNHDLTQAIHKGSFRADLYYRLNVISIPLPPLQERREDVSALLEHFLHTKGEKIGCEGKFFTEEAHAFLLRYSWPGNVRELENLVERCMILSDGLAMGPEDLPLYVCSSQQLPSSPQGRPRVEKALEEVVGEFERDIILAALTQVNFNQTRAAEFLGTTRRILRYKMERLGIPFRGTE
jgi:two-component system, NtrC family, response regulator AtoC